MKYVIYYLGKSKTLVWNNKNVIPIMLEIFDYRSYFKT